MTTRCNYLIRGTITLFCFELFQVMCVIVSLPLGHVSYIGLSVYVGLFVSVGLSMFVG